MPVGMVRQLRMPPCSGCFLPHARGDGPLEVVCPGEFPHPDLRVGVQKVELADLQALLGEFETEKAEAGANWAGLCLSSGIPRAGIVPQRRRSPSSRRRAT